MTAQTAPNTVGNPTHNPALFIQGTYVGATAVNVCAGDYSYRIGWPQDGSDDPVCERTLLETSGAQPEPVPPKEIPSQVTRMLPSRK